MTLLSLANVTQRFPAGREDIVALDDLSLTVNDGDFIGIHGERRSGKSTLLRIAAGWEEPNHGSVVFAGRDLWALADGARAKLRRRHGVGLISGHWRPTANKPALRHVQEALVCSGLSLREAQAPALLALERVGLARCAYAPSNRLSHGDLIRLALAQRLAHCPRMLLVDEPAVLLRPSEAAEFYELLESLGQDPDVALVIASEELTPLRNAQRILSLHNGALRSMDMPSGRILEFPDQRTTAKHA
jgi:predicted ABC-type transport system involved in lysophospholipase L1 biosynthesis ATPase subunit